MEDRKLKEIGADSLGKLLNKANELGITKEDIVQIVELNKEFHMIYVE